MKRLLIPGFLAALTFLSPARTFTNQKGQKFEGSLVAVDSTSVEILGADGKKYKTALETLSADDKKFCIDWRAANPAMKLTVKADGFVAKGTRETTNDNSSSGSASAVSRTRTLQEGYRITVSNWSKDPGAKVSGLKVDYAIVVGFTDTTAKDKRGVKEVVKGSADLPELTGTNAGTVETVTVRTGQSAAVVSETVRDSSGSSRTSSAGALRRESMDGICLVIKHDGRIVATYTTGKVPDEVKSAVMK